MKNRFWWLLPIILTATTCWSGCFWEEEKSLVKPVAEVEFLMNTNDLVFNKSVNGTTCLELADLIAIAEDAAQGLMAHLEIIDSEAQTYSFDTNVRVVRSQYPEANDITQPNPQLGEKRLVTNSIKLPWKEATIYKLMQLYIYRTNDAAKTILYSTVIKDGDIHKIYGKLLDDCVIDPYNEDAKSIIVTKKYDISYQGICLHCAVTH